MDTRTGEIFELDGSAESKRRLEAAGTFAALLGKRPDPNCNICFGRGHTGFNVTHGKFVPCKCTHPEMPQSTLTRDK